jgi:HPt (histidine-containing phosphotransfer) domain-containing protein
MRPRRRATVSETERHPLEACDKDIAQLYLKTATAQLKKMGLATRSKSMADLQHLAHKLCGASAFLGLKVIAKLLSDLEQAAAHAQMKESTRCLGLVKVEFGHIQHQSRVQKTGGRFPVSIKP